MPHNSNREKSRTTVYLAIKWRLVLNILLVAVLIQHVSHVAHAAQKSSNSKSVIGKKRHDINGEEPTAVDYGENDETQTYGEVDYVTTSSLHLGNVNVRHDQIDLRAYGNEFDEASIPEDILDQEHMQDIDVMADASVLNFRTPVDQDSSTSLKFHEISSGHNRNISIDEKKPAAWEEKAIPYHNRDKSISSVLEETHKSVDNVPASFRSIGPLTFHARNMGKKQIPQIDDKDKPNKMNKYFNKPYKSNKQSSIMSGSSIKPNKSAIGDIEDEQKASNEDERFYDDYKNSINNNNRRIEHVENHLLNSRTLIDSDGEIGKNAVHEDNLSGETAHVNGAQLQTAFPFISQIVTTTKPTNIQMESDDFSSRSRKQRRHLPEMNFGHQREDIDMYDNKDDLISVDDDQSEQRGLSSTSADYWDFEKIGTNSTLAEKKHPVSKTDGHFLYVAGTFIDNGEPTANETNKARRRDPPATVRDTNFEQHKAKQRYNRRNGHKTHKKKYKDYLRHVWAISTASTENPIAPNNIDMALDSNNNGSAKTMTNYTNKTSIENEWKEIRQQQRAQKLRAEKSRGFPVPPIFVIATTQPLAENRHNASVSQSSKMSDKPFYEGQINYYLETRDDDDNHEHAENERNIVNNNFDSAESSSSSSWYNRVGPMLRNGWRGVPHNQNMDNDVAAEHHIQKHTQQQPHRKQLHHRNRQHTQREHNHHQHHNHNHHHGKQMEHEHVHHFSHAFHHRHHQKHHNNKLQHQLLEQSLSADVEREHNTMNTTPDNAEIPTPNPPLNNKRGGMPPAMGHQITELEDFERYYAKWPHLARVQFQVYDEHMREAHDQQEQQQIHQIDSQIEQKKSESHEYPEYEYESLADLEEAQKETAEDANLPPYIRKYNRRNKQLLNLLEGPLPPPQGYHWSGSKLQPGPLESSSDASVVRLDDEYMQEKRKRYHQLHNNNQKHDLFSQQRKSNQSISEVNLQPTPQMPYSNATKASVNQLAASNNNHLPDEDVKVSAEDIQKDNWKKEIESEIKSKWHDMTEIIGNVAHMHNWHDEKSVTPTPNIVTLSSSSTSTPTPKTLVFRLPSFNNKGGDGYSMRQRSRSAHFASSPGQLRHSSGFLDSMEIHGYSAEQEANSKVLNDSIATPTELAPKIATLPPRSISAFVYHRVVDDSAPKIVGTGSGVQGRKQQLPFVAITDRRLETFKKSLLERQKEFEQNNFPPLP